MKNTLTHNNLILKQNNMKNLKATIATTLLLLSTIVFAQDKMANNIDNSNIALEGYSPVSYLDLSLAQLGTKSFKSEYKSIVYYFTSAEQKTTFDKNPTRYLPQYGGFCAFGAFAGAKFRVNPNKFIVKDGKYYLFLYNVELDAQQLWMAEKNHKKLQTTADKNWANLSKTHN